MASISHSNNYVGSSHYSAQLKKFGILSLVTLFTLLIALTFLMPFGYGFITAFKDRDQIVRSAGGSILPMDPVIYHYAPSLEYEGGTYPLVELRASRVTATGTRQYVKAGILVEGADGEQVFIEDNGDEFPVMDSAIELRVSSSEYEFVPFEISELEQLELEIFSVPMEDGSYREMAAFDPKQQETTFVDMDDPSAEPYVWEGRLPTLDRKMEFAPRTGNFKEAWNSADFPLLFRNTLIIAALGLLGTLMSSICVAYAFARFPIPGKNFLFLVLVGTIILPNQVRLIPTYAFFSRIHWTGTWLPLIVPHFFANAYNVFLLRQYFLTLPREMDEAAMIDGAGPFTILIRIIVPQSWPVIVAVGLFHFVFAWNDYFEPLIYLLGKPNLQPISVGIQQFNFQYDQQPHLIQATSLLALVVPVIVFFLAQRFFMRGVVITGVDK